jgi:Mrp family chromosome partitioning ATPase
MSRIFKALERAENERPGATLDVFHSSQVLNPQSEIDIPWQSQQYEKLRVNLTLVAGQAELKSIMLVSTLPQEGVSTVTLGLGTAMAEGAHQGVLLVDVHSPRPSLAQRLGVSPRRGLSELLAKKATRQEVIEASPVGGLFFLGRGRGPADLSHARSLGIFEEVLAELRLVYDYVLFDGGSLEASPDCLCMVGRVDGIVLVVQAERTKSEAVREVSGHLRKAGGKLLGVVLNRRREYLPSFMSRRA